MYVFSLTLFNFPMYPRAYCGYQSEEIKIINFLNWEWNPQPSPSKPNGLNMAYITIATYKYRYIHKTAGYTIISATRLTDRLSQTTEQSELSVCYLDSIIKFCNYCIVEANFVVR